MYLHKPRELFQSCRIKPLDDQEGLIICIKYDNCACEVLVRYFLHGMLQYNWFFDFDIELKDPIKHDNDFFKEY